MGRGSAFLNRSMTMKSMLGPSAREPAGEVIDRQRLAGRMHDELVPAQRRARRHEALAQVRPGGGGLDGGARGAGLARKRPGQLRGRDLAQQVVLVVDGRKRDVDL